MQIRILLSEPIDRWSGALEWISELVSSSVSPQSLGAVASVSTNHALASTSRRSLALQFLWAVGAHQSGIGSVAFCLKLMINLLWICRDPCLSTAWVCRNLHLRNEIDCHLQFTARLLQLLPANFSRLGSWVKGALAYAWVLLLLFVSFVCWSR